jgi:hypothetical protein
MDNDSKPIDRSDGNWIQPEPQPATTSVLQEPAPEARERDAEEMRSFIQRYGLAMQAWVKTHGKKPMPIVQDENGKLRWVNRDARKKLRKQRKTK